MSIKRVLDAAMLSSFAHLDEEGIKKALINTDYEPVGFVSVDFLQCHIVKDKTKPKDQVVMFRESTDVKDWLGNLDFLPKNTAYGVLHNGFYDILMKARKEIMSYIYDKKFVTASFSQGASLGRLFCHIVTKREALSKYKPFFVSFEPAMESKTDDYNTYGIWTMKGNDPVCMLPPKLTGWNQSGALIYLTGRRCKAFVNPKKLKKILMVAADTVMDLEDNFSSDDILRDHSVQIIKGNWKGSKNEEKIINLAKSFGLK